MKKRLFLTFQILCIFIISIYGQSDDLCKHFKTGSYIYKEYPYTNVRVKRNHKYQKEHETITGFKIHHKIKWTNSCEYTLTQTWTNEKKLKKNKGSIIKVKIIKFNKTSYKYIADYNGNITSYTMIKIK